MANNSSKPGQPAPDDRHHETSAVGVSRDAPRPETSDPLPESSEEEAEEEHNAPHADNYDALAATTNDAPATVKKKPGSGGQS